MHSILDVGQGSEYTSILLNIHHINNFTIVLKAGVPPSKKSFYIYFHESPLKVIKNIFHFTLEVLFVLKIFISIPVLTYLIM